MTIKTGLPLPSLELPLVGGQRRLVNWPGADKFLVLVFYRGAHCRRCGPYLNAFQALLPEFEAVGAEVIAVSADDKDRAEESCRAWEIRDLAMAHDFPLGSADEWGLYLTEGRKAEDPPLFTEPALFVVWPDGKLDHGVIATAQRLRPEPKTVLEHVRERRAEIAAAGVPG